VYRGTTQPTDYKLGSNAVSKLYLGATQVWPAAAAATDPYFNQVALLLHGDSLTDSSRFGRSITTSASAAVSSVRKKFGSGSLYFPLGGSSAFNISTSGGRLDIYGDFALEWWQYLSSVSEHQYLFTSGRGTGFGETPFSPDWNYSSGKLRPTFDANVQISYGSALAVTQWQYIAISRTGNTIRLYVDGTLVGSATDERALLTNVTTAKLGYDGAFRYGISDGYIDDLRLSTINRGYTGNTIAVPTAPFPDSQASGAFAVILTSGTSFTVPSGYTSMTAWAIGQGGRSQQDLPGGSGGMAYKTWTVTGGSTVTYSVGQVTGSYAGNNSTVTYNGSTITGGGAPEFDPGASYAGQVGNYYGGDGGMNGSPPSARGDNHWGGALGNTMSYGTAGIRTLSGVSGLFEAVALAGSEGNPYATAVIGAGAWLNTKDGTSLAAGFGGGWTMYASETPGAVVLKFS
jgi:Concanavalin A-like lectin/glucanases superfamily